MTQSSDAETSKSSMNDQVVDSDNELDGEVSTSYVRRKGWVGWIFYFEYLTEEFFGDLGRRVARNPKRYMAVSVLCAVLCCFGWAFFKVELNTIEVLVAQDHWLRQSEYRHHAVWGKITRTSIALYTKEDESKDMLTKDTLLKLLDIRENILSKTVDVEDREKTTDKQKMMESYCYRPLGGDCLQFSIFSYYECYPTTEPCVTAKNFTMIRQRVETYDPHTVVSRALATNAVGSPINQDFILGSRVRTGATVSSAQAILETYLLLETLDNVKGIRKLEGEIRKDLSKAKKETTDINFGYYSKATEEHSYVEILVKGLPFVTACFTVMVIFVVLVIGQKPPVHSRVLLGLAALFNVWLAIMSSFGVMLVFGYYVQGLSQLSFFVVLGLGVDGMFLLVRVFERDDPGGDNTAEGKLVRSFKANGRSVSLAAMTTCVSFLTNLSSGFPAIQGFSFNAAAALLINLFLMFTFFGGAMVLDQRRIDDNRYDVIFWKTKKGKGVVKQDLKQGSNLLSRIFASYGRALTTSPGREAFVVLFFGLLALSIWGATNTIIAYEPTDLMLRNSAVPNLIKATRKHFANTPVAVEFLIGEVDYKDPAIQAAVYKLSNDITNVPAVLSATSWFGDFATYANHTKETVPEGEFQTSFGAWSQTMGFVTHAEDILLRGLKIGETRMNLQLRREKVEDATKTMKDLKDLCDDGVLPCYLYSDEFAENVVYDGTKQALSWPIVIPFVVVCLIVLLSVHPVVGAVIIFNLACLYVEVLGLIRLFELDVSPPTTATLSASLGISVDYTLHIGHSFVTGASYNNRVRATRALELVGPSVLVGGFTTILGMVVLATGPAKGFLTFSAAYVIVVAVALYHGLFVFPIMLSFINTHNPPEDGVSSGLDDGEGEGSEMTSAN